MFSAYDVRTTIYEIPLVYAAQKLDEIVVRKLHLPPKGLVRDGWRAFVDRFVAASRTVKVAIVGKYTNLHDSYISVFEALLHGAVANDARVELVKVEGEDLEEGRDPAEVFAGCDGMLVPGGFGSRGIEGMVRAARFARESGFPYLGLCLGLQIMVVEYARTVLGIADANSTEFAPDSKSPVVSLLEEQVDVKTYGGTMRLGRGDSHLAPNTRIAAAYGRRVISERHRHRYEVSNRYRRPLEDAGLIVSALTADESLVEAVEWPDHPWGVGVQFHPEFTSRPTAAGPLFTAFIDACLTQRH